MIPMVRNGARGSGPTAEDARGPLTPPRLANGGPRRRPCDSFQFRIHSSSAGGECPANGWKGYYSASREHGPPLVTTAQLRPTRDNSLSGSPGEVANRSRDRVHAQALKTH